MVKSTKSNLLLKLKNNTARIGIMEYVSLPLAVPFAKASFHVAGFDTVQRNVDWQAIHHTHGPSYRALHQPKYRPMLLVDFSHLRKWVAEAEERIKPKPAPKPEENATQMTLF